MQRKGRELKLDYKARVKLKPAWGYGIYWLEFWCPRKMDWKTVEYYGRYIGKTLADYGISNGITISELPNMQGYYIDITLLYPKGVKGLQRKIINIMEKLKARHILGEFSKPDINSWNGRRTIYRT